MFDCCGRVSILAALISAFLVAQSDRAHGQANVNLNTWTEITNDGNGFWDVDNNGTEGSGPNGDFVRQEVNGAPTIYLSPDSFINTVIEGSFRVDTGNGSDYQIDLTATAIPEPTTFALLGLGTLALLRRRA